MHTDKPDKPVDLYLNSELSDDKSFRQGNICYPGLEEVNVHKPIHSYTYINS